MAAEWLAAGADVGAGALARLEVEATAGLGLLAWKPPEPGCRPAMGWADTLVDALAADRRAVVVDCGSGAAGGLAVAAGAHESLLRAPALLPRAAPGTGGSCAAVRRRARH